MFSLDFMAGWFSALLFIGAYFWFRRRIGSVTGDGKIDWVIWFRHIADKSRPLHALWCPYCAPEEVTRRIQFRGIR